MTWLSPNYFGELIVSKTRQFQIGAQTLNSFRKKSVTECKNLAYDYPDHLKYIMHTTLKPPIKPANIVQKVKQYRNATAKSIEEQGHVNSFLNMVVNKVYYLTDMCLRESIYLKQPEL